MTTLASNDVDQARKALRRHARSIMREASNVSAHLGRLHAALTLAGSEPAQGALADMFVAFGESQSVLKRAGLELARDRLAGHVLRWFESQVEAPALYHITPLATRWSVLATSSADISTRARRCSVDDSRLLAAQAIGAIERKDEKSLQEFLHHCVTCHDNLAFMLARRAMLRTGVELPPEWDLTSKQLEQSMELT
ncbi:MAG: hypothetical protein FD135_2190 [Comamonadaceae bacterium]|nr:MAG: hypothetical protein FD135_2190 [Comamonadaceae bacterium]